MKRIKTLVLKRAYFGEGVNVDLETVLSNLVKKFTKPEDRVTALDLFRQQACAHVEKNIHGAGHFARFFEFEEGATGLVDLAKKNMSDEIEELLPPETKKFLIEEIVLLVHQNTIIACNLGNKQGTFSAMLHSLAEKHGLLDKKTPFRISDVPNRKTLEQIKETGIKSIDLSIESYLGSMREIDNRTLTDRILRAMFLTPDGDANLQKRASMRAKLHITKGRLSKEEVLKDSWITNLGTEIIDSGFSDDYKIVLEDDDIISNQNLKVTKKVKISKHANSVSYEHTKQELAQCLREFEANGATKW